MSDPLKITRISLSGPAPFQDCEIDLTDPETGEPLDEICIIGPNGTGKAMLLRQLRCSAEFRSPRIESDAWSDSLVVTEFLHEDRRVFLARPGAFDEQGGANLLWLGDTYDEEKSGPGGIEEFHDRFGDLQIPDDEEPERPTVHSFGGAEPTEPAELADFLAAVARNREDAFSRELRLPEHREKTVAEIEREFGKSHRDVFQELGVFWAKAIPGMAAELAGEGDFMSKLERFEPGIRSLLLRTGELVKNRDEEGPRFLFLDGAGHGLDPATSIHALEIYRSALGEIDSQTIVTTDCPLVATQFEPASRIRLGRDELGSLSAERGVAPLGADATQLLRRDFEATSESAAKHREHHERLHDDYGPDEDELADLIDEASWARKR